MEAPTVSPSSISRLKRVLSSWWQFSFATLISLLVCAIAVCILVRELSLNHIIEMGESNNVNFSKTLLNTTWPTYAPFMETALKLNRQQLINHTQNKNLLKLLTKHARSLPILKLNILSLNGKTLFSTDQNEIGKIAPTAYLSDISKESLIIVSKLSQHPTINTFSGIATNRHLLTSYIPIYQEFGGQKIPQAVFVIHLDITKFYQKTRQHQWLVFTSIIAIFSLFYLVLLKTSRRTVSVANDKTEEVGNHLEHMETAKHILESEVEQGTNELQRAVNELEQYKEHLEELVHERTLELSRTKDEAINANKAKSIFLANMSHELRTPLNAILGYTELIREDHPKNSQSWEDLDKVYTAGNHLLRLINDILDISKIEAGKMESFIEKVNIIPSVEEVISSIRTLAEEKNNKIIIQCDESFGEIETDITKFRQILYNLISNANKFTENGSITISINRNVYQNQEWLKLVVTDTGVGMTKSQIKKIFNNFTQADSSTTRKHGGTGLGLSICQGLCQILGGMISVESEIQHGAKFVIRLPTSGMPEEASRVVDFTSIGPKVDPKSVRVNPVLQDFNNRRKRVSTILAIDDDANIRDLMERYLSRSGFYIHTAASADEGIALAYEVNPDVIILDIMMPEKDGISALREIKTNEQLLEIPVIMLTIAGERETCMALGANSYVNKPIEWEFLKELIIDNIRRRQAILANGN